MYRDYPISPTLFHWESQSTTSVASPTGQRYLNGSSTVLLFVRDAAGPTSSAQRRTSSSGRRDYVEHTGDRPIAITWRLDVPMPSGLLHRARPSPRAKSGRASWRSLRFEESVIRGAAE